MTTRFAVSLVLVCAGVFGSAAPAAAQQTVNFTLGYFTLRGADARVEGDVLNANTQWLRRAGTEELIVPSDFNGPVFGAEWLVALGRYVEAGAGLGFSRRTVDSSYDEFLEDTGTGFVEIEQALRLRLVPIAFTVRVLPLGQDTSIQPYAGAGLGLINWRYSEVGDFIDFSVDPYEVFDEAFVGSGTAPGPIVLGGLRYAADTFTVGGEVRYHSASADLEPNEFFGSRIDLGGWTYQFTVGVRFGR